MKSETMTIARAFEIQDNSKRGVYDYSPEEGLNAVRLIKQIKESGPDLLNALHDVLAHSFYGDSTGYQHVEPGAIERARKAITKATQQPANPPTT